MLIKYSSLTAVLIAVASCLTNTASAIELRTTYENQDVVRTVSYWADEPTLVEEAEEPAAVAEQSAPVVKQPMSSEPMIMHEQEVFYEEPWMGMEASCGSSCYPGPMLCSDKLWVEFEYLLWWREGRYLPPLVTTPSPGTLPGSTVLYGGGQVDEKGRPGGRLELGWWLDPCRCTYVAAHYVAVGDSLISQNYNSGDFSFIARPYFDSDPGTNAPNAQVVANTAIGQTGALDLTSNSSFVAADVMMGWMLRQNCCSRLDFVFGYQFGQIDEDLTIRTTTTNSDIGTLDLTDSFVTKNEFNGVNFGLQGDYSRGCFGLEVLAKFGFGNLKRTAILSGARTPNIPSGLLVQDSTNAGTFTSDETTYMHDIGAKLTYRPFQRVKLSLGYSMMFFGDVFRPGNQIALFNGQPIVDGRLAGNEGSPNATDPALNLQTTHYFIHGLNAGLEYRF